MCVCIDLAQAPCHISGGRLNSVCQRQFLGKEEETRNQFMWSQLTIGLGVCKQPEDPASCIVPVKGDRGSQLKVAEDPS